jgi:uncharacterized membrane protein YbhN (UPF0104 family)
MHRAARATRTPSVTNQVLQSREPAARTQQWLVLVAKVAVSAALIAYASGKIDIVQASRQLRNIPGWAVAAVAGLLFVQLCVAALRLQQVLFALDARCRFLKTLDVAFIGAFFSQTLISFLGGDAMRIWRITRSNVSLGVATKGVALDRAAGLAGALVLVMLTLPFLFDVLQEPAMRRGLLVAVSGCVAGLALLLAVGHTPAALRQIKLFQWVSELAQAAVSIVRSAKRLALLLTLSMLVHLLNVVVLFVLAVGLSVDITLWHSLLLIPPVLLLSMLPISVAGWGVREGAMIVALGQIGVRSDQSVAVSVGFGLSLIAISLPGAILWLMQRRQGTDRRAGAGAGRAAEDTQGLAP